MTEQEAKEKWCPMARVANALHPNGSTAIAGFTVANRSSGVGDVPVNSMCLGSSCMAWRWINDPAGPQPPDGPESDYRGYCGLAGKS